MIFSHCSNKLCPLFVAASLANSDRAMQIEAQERNSVCCVEESCAWWAGDSCAVIHLLTALLPTPTK